MITKPSDWMQNDSRFKSWGKKVGSGDLDLSKENGYALGGKFVNWGENVALGDGEFLVVAAETGSRANRSYSYALIEGGEAGHCLCNTQDKSKGLSAENWKILKTEAMNDLPEEQKAKAMNSTLYRFAAVIRHMTKHERVAAVLSDRKAELKMEAERLRSRLEVIEAELARI